MIHPDRIAALVSQIAEEAISDLVSLVRIPSVTGAEAAAQEWLAGRLRALGAEVDMWVPDVAQLRRHPAFPVVNAGDLDGRPNLVARFPGAGGGAA